MLHQFSTKRVLAELNIIYKCDFTITNKSHRIEVQRKIGYIILQYKIANTDEAYIRAFGNAFNHGKTPIYCSVYVSSDNKLLIIIQDSGKGFDYQKMIEKFKSGKKYYHRHGHGTHEYNKNTHSRVSFSNNGKTSAILYN